MSEQVRWMTTAYLSSLCGCHVWWFSCEELLLPLCPCYCHEAKPVQDFSEHHDDFLSTACIENHFLLFNFLICVTNYYPHASAAYLLLQAACRWHGTFHCMHIRSCSAFTAGYVPIPEVPVHVSVTLVLLPYVSPLARVSWPPSAVSTPACQAAAAAHVLLDG